MYAYELVYCSKCLEPKGKKCRTLKTRRLTDTHAQRMRLAWPGVPWHAVILDAKGVTRAMLREEKS